MRVICINDKPLFGKPEAEWLIKNGDIYTVVEIVARYNNPYYVLDIQPDVGYSPENFIPLSEIDETQMERQSLETIKL